MTDDDNRKPIGAFGWLLVGSSIGVWVMIVGVELFKGGTLDKAQTAYKHCVQDGAPKQSCIDRYLLPKETTP